MESKMEAGLKCGYAFLNFRRTEGMAKRAIPPKSAKLIGSGTGVRIWLVMIFRCDPAPNTSVSSWEREYGVVVRDVITLVRVLDGELAPE
jgi:hypothetical protein